MTTGTGKQRGYYVSEEEKQQRGAMQATLREKWEEQQMSYIDDDTPVPLAQKQLIVEAGRDRNLWCVKCEGERIKVWVEWKPRVTRRAQAVTIVACRECDKTEYEYCTRRAGALKRAIGKEARTRGVSEEQVLEELIQKKSGSGHWREYT